MVKKIKIYVLLFCLVLFGACSGKKTPVEQVQSTLAAAAMAQTSAQPGALPMAILQTGEYPLWFQLTDEGPVLLESIEDAVFSAALVPWPLALHVRFFLVKGDELLMAINRDGFMKLARETAFFEGLQKAPNNGSVQGIGLYRFSGGEFWRQYTVGGFILYEDKPAAILYLDDRFLDSDSPLPMPRAWTFNMESNAPFPLDIPALELFPVEEGWDADTLRPGSDGYWYYRVSKKSGSRHEVRMFRTADLAQAGEAASLGAFQNSAPREPEKLEHFSLPLLPEGFYYTGAGMAGGNLFACWEEQEDFNIGAAGFVVMKP